MNKYPNPLEKDLMLSYIFCKFAIDYKYVFLR